MLVYQVLAAILFVSGSYALYNSYPDVIKLTPDNFDKLVTNSTDVWIVMFYAPWCGWSRVAVSEYARGACALKGIAKLGAVDADKYDALGQRYGLIGYPLIKVFIGSKDQPYEYKRKAAMYVEAVMDAIRQKATDNLMKGACKRSADDESSSSSESEEDNKETTTETAPETTTLISAETTTETAPETTTLLSAETTTQTAPETTTLISAETTTQTAPETTTLISAETTTETAPETTTLISAETTTQTATVNSAETTPDTDTTTTDNYDFGY